MVRKKRKEVVKGLDGKTPKPKAIALHGVFATHVATQERGGKETLGFTRWVKEKLMVLSLTDIADEIENASDLFAQVEAVRAFKAKMALLVEDLHGGATHDDLEVQQSLYLFVRESLEYILELFFSPHIAELRLPMVSLLQVLWKCGQSLEHSGTLEIACTIESKVFAKRIQTFLHGLKHAPREELIAHYNQLWSLASFEPLCGVVAIHQSNLYILLEYFAEELQHLTDLFREFNANHVESEMNSQEVLNASEQCSIVFKAIIMFLPMLSEQVKNDMNKGDSHLVDLFHRLTVSCFEVLRTSIICKDYLTQAALLFVFFFKAKNDLVGEVSTPTYLCHLVCDICCPDDSSSFQSTEFRMQTLDCIAKLAFCRSVCMSLEEALLLSSAASQSTLFFGPVFNFLSSQCANHDLNVRVYAFQVLEAWLRRAKDLCDGNADLFNLEKLTKIIDIVLVNWEHPSKRVNQFMKPMFGHVVSFLQRIQAEDVGRVISDPLIELLERLKRQPFSCRGKYLAISMLIPKFQERLSLNHYVDIFAQCLVGMDKNNTASSAATLCISVIEQLYLEKEMTEHLWFPRLMDGLLSENEDKRTNVAIYILPLLLKSYPRLHQQILTSLREHHIHSKNVSEDFLNRILWAKLEVAKCARRNSLDRGLNAFGGAHEKCNSLNGNVALLSNDELRMCLLHANSDLQISTFEYICSSVKGKEMPTEQEISLVQSFLSFLMKNTQPEHRTKMLSSTKNFFVLIRESALYSLRDAIAYLPYTLVDRSDVEEQRNRAQLFHGWLEDFLMNCIYPGSPPHRLQAALECIGLSITTFCTQPEKFPSSLYSPSFVYCLLHHMVSCWDKVRIMSYELLVLYPTPLPGLVDSLTCCKDILRWALALCNHPRHRDSDGGALLLRLLYRHAFYVRELGVLICSQSSAFDHEGDSQAWFLHQLVSLVEHRLKVTEEVYESKKTMTMSEESPMVHGILSAIRYIIQDTEFEKKTLCWRILLTRIFEIVWRVMRFSMAIVGDASYGFVDGNLPPLKKIDEPILNAVEEEGGNLGAINANSTVPASISVDCRGHVVLDDPEFADGDVEQRLVMGAWLAVRDCSGVLNHLVSCIPLPTDAFMKKSQGDASKTTPLVTEEAYRQTGECLLKGLFALKHGGAVAHVHQSFEAVCKALLQHGDQNRRLGNLPAEWIQTLLDRLQSSSQQFILRRSAGFALSFMSILRSEPRNASATLLPRVMKDLLNVASSRCDEDGSSSWRARVHALNILKLIFHDATLAYDMASYLVAGLRLALSGFHSPSWAVRNSSMMVFTAVSQRIIGDRRITDGASKNGITIVDLLSRLPGIEHVFYEELRDAAQKGSETHATLYPLLVLLSRLRPSSYYHETFSPVFRSCFPFIEGCCKQKKFMIRSMAAMALAAICPLDGIPMKLQELFDQLPLEWRNVSECNKVHGLLLHLRHLLESLRCRSSESHETEGFIRDVIYQALGVVCTNLEKRPWMFDGPLECPTIHASCMMIFKVVLESCPSSYLPSLTSLQDKFIACGQKYLENRMARTKTADVPGQKLCDETSTELVVTQALGRSLCIKFLTHLLQTDRTHIRAQATASLSSILLPKLATFDASLLRTIWWCIREQCMVESHPILLGQQLEILQHLLSTSHLAISLSNNADVHSVLIDSVALIHRLRDGKLRGLTLRLLGTVIGYLEKHGTMSSLDDIIDPLCLLVAELSVDSQPRLIRLGCAFFLKESYLLAENNGRCSISSKMDLWFTGLRLVQDDDSDVREEARVALASSLFTFEHWKRNSLSGIVLVEAVEFVMKTFALQSTYVERLFDLLLWCTDVENDMKLMLASFEDTEKFKVFEIEKNNQYIESSLYVQLIAKKLPCAVSENVRFALLRVFANQCARCLQVWVDTLSNLSQEAVVQLSHHPEIFPRFHNLMLLVAALCRKTTMTNEMRLLMNHVSSSIDLLLRSVPRMHQLIHDVLYNLRLCVHYSNVEECDINDYFLLDGSLGQLSIYRGSQ